MFAASKNKLFVSLTNTPIAPLLEFFSASLKKRLTNETLEVTIPVYAIQRINMAGIWYRKCTYDVLTRDLKVNLIKLKVVEWAVFAWLNGHLVWRMCL